jgi:hypothetical protein
MEGILKLHPPIRPEGQTSEKVAPLVVASPATSRIRGPRVTPGMGPVLAAAMKKIRKSAGRFMHSTSAIRPLVRPSTSLRTVGLMSLRVPWWRRSPTLGFAVFEEGHQLVQDLHELVDMGAGLRYQISTLFEGQVRRYRDCGSARASERRRGSDGDTGPNSCIGGVSPTGR